MIETNKDYGNHQEMENAVQELIVEERRWMRCYNRWSSRTFSHCDRITNSGGKTLDEVLQQMEFNKRLAIAIE